MNRSKGFSSQTNEIIISVVVVVFVLLIGYATYMDMKDDKKRKKAHRKYCEENGFQYTEISESIPGCNEKFDMLLRGKNQSIENIMSGTKGDYEFQIFDFHYYLERHSPRSPINTYNKEFVETLCFLRKKGEKAFPHFYMLQNTLLNEEKEKAKYNLYIKDVYFLPKIEGIKEIEFPLEEGLTLVVRSSNEEEMKEFYTNQRIDSIKRFFDETGGFIYIYEGKGDCLLAGYTRVMSIEERLEILDCAIKMYEAL